MKFYKTTTLLFLLLGACAPEVTNWTPSENPKKNVVDRVILNHLVAYPAHSSSMGSREKRELKQFLTSKVQHPSSVTIVLVEFGGHSEKRIRDIERELVLFGIPHHLITVDSLEDNRRIKSSHQGSGVEIIVERYFAIPPSCADFSQTIGSADQVFNNSNYGCADTSNLGLMIANPRDLIKGRSLGDSDGAVMAAGILRYRSDKVKALMDTSTNASLEQTTSQPSTPSTGTASAGGGGAY